MLKFWYLGILLVEGKITPEKVVINNRLLHLVDAEYFFYRLILDAYRVISNVSLYGSGSFVGGWVRVRFWCCGSCEMAH